MAAMAPHLEAQTVVTDAGSTKRDVIEAAYRHLDANLARVVPSHPIAGAEKKGGALQPPGALSRQEGRHHPSSETILPPWSASARFGGPVAQCYAKCRRRSMTAYSPR